MRKTIFFDLDGTLLPMDQEVFTKAYFKRLAAKLAPYGYEPKALIDGIWAGTAAMIRNDGSCTNETAFWRCFTELFGEKAKTHIPVFEDYYYNEFQQVQTACGFTPHAKQLIDQLKLANYRLVLATNPIFPAIATESRIRWAGLCPADFEYFTTYENSCYCKPNPLYYKEILDKLGMNASDCIMVGNDADDDTAAAALGMDVFLLTDCLINKHNLDLNQYPHGDFRALAAFLNL